MKNKIHINIIKMLESKLVLMLAASSMLMSCGVYMGGYSETDGVYYDPSQDSVPQYSQDRGNRVGEYYDYGNGQAYDNPDDSQFGYEEESIIADGRYNKEQEMSKYQRWGGNTAISSDWGVYTGTDTYYSDWGNPYYSPYSYWGYPGWSFGFNYMWGYPGWGFGFNHMWGHYPYWSYPYWGYPYAYNPYWGWGGYWGSPYGYPYHYYYPGYVYRYPYADRSKNVLRNSNNGFRSQMNKVVRNNNRRTYVRNRNGFQNHNNSYRESTIRRHQGFRNQNNNTIRRNTTTRNNGFRNNNSYQNRTFQRQSSPSRGFSSPSQRSTNFGTSVRSSRGGRR